MDTKKIRTRQEIQSLNNPKSKDYIIGLDTGYSSTKCFYENGYFVFPSFAKKLEGKMLNIQSDYDILYRDEDTGEVYMVGYVAQDMTESTDTNDTDGELFSRKRYGDKRYKIICNTAVAMALSGKNDDRRIVIQTGLPSSYVAGDSPAIKKTLSKTSRFSIKVGRGGWKLYEPEIKQEDIFVMAQPAGALYSVLIKNDGNYVNDAINILSSNVLVADIGFGTFDFYGIKNRTVVCKDSIDEIGMREVLSRTSKRILSEMNEDIKVAALQKNLMDGYVVCVDEENMKTTKRPIADIVEASSREVMKEAMMRAKSITDAFRGYEYLILDGGTGEAWYSDIKEWLSGMETLKIMPSNFNDHLPMIYSNARGYYMYRYMAGKK